MIQLPEKERKIISCPKTSGNPKSSVSLFAPDFVQGNRAADQSPVIHRAKWVVVDSETIYPNGFVNVFLGRIVDVGTGQCDSGHVIDHGDGALCPAFVNGHTHLELTALEGQVRYDSGFEYWVSELIRLRAEMHRDDLLHGIRQGIEYLLDAGCPIIGEVSTLGLSKEVLLASDLSGLWFHEILGNKNPENKPGEGLFDVKEDLNVTLAGSLAGHAPHTTAPDLLVDLKRLTNKKKRTFSIHVSESAAEHEFITTAKGLWADFLASRGINYSDWGLPAGSPVVHLDRLGILDQHTLAVHALYIDQKDLRLLKESNCCICICPRSNYNLHRKTPDLTQMLKYDLQLCLGTDSLASVDSLGIMNEMTFISEAFSGIAPHLIFKMATANGAKALGRDKDFGTLHTGKKAWLAYLPLEADNPKQIFDKIVHGEIGN